MKRARRSVFIVGAGFSMYAGMPLQEDFTSALLEGRGTGSGASGAVVTHVRKFVNRAFDHGIHAPSRYWPELEDVFTCLDLSANTGHDLGPHHRPADLRTIRRGLIYRIITMLRERYRSTRERPSTNRARLVQLMKEIRGSNSTFISTNWDTVVEDMWQEIDGIESFDYGCQAIRASLHPGSNTIREIKFDRNNSAQIIKMHGSVNWLYCDCCRSLFWLPTRETNKVAAQLLSAEERQNIGTPGQHSDDRWSCSRCSGRFLGIRLATFSYRKALDFPMFQRSWFSAERLLRSADNWIFIGYSLPAADFEFKYLLKRVQLSRPQPPEFAVISGGSGADKTHRNFQRFFGRSIRRGETFFSNGLNAQSIGYIANLVH